VRFQQNASNPLTAAKINTSYAVPRLPETWRNAVKSGLRAILLVISAVLAGSATYAADDAGLVRILARADMAHNLALYCAQYDPTIINKTKSTVGDVQALMLHIRGEVIAELPQVEAAQIVLRAATAAKSDALRAVRRLYGSDPQQERIRIANWCKESAVPFVQELVTEHEKHHEVLAREINSAKHFLQGVK